MTYTPEQMLKTAKVFEDMAISTSFEKSIAAQLRQGADAVRAAEAGKVLRKVVGDWIDEPIDGPPSLTKAADDYDAAITETKP